MPCKALFLAVVEGVCMVSGGLCVWILCRSGRLLMATPSLFPALRRVFSKFRRLYRERGKAVFISGRHCVRQALFPSSPFVLTDVCAGFDGG